MASALEQLTNNYETEQPVSFYDYYNAYGYDHRDTAGGWLHNWSTHDPYSAEGKLQNFFHGTRNSAEKEYENYLGEYEYHRNQKATSAQNELTMAREDSQVQRLVADYEKAGLNPYLVLNGGNVSGGVSSQASAPSYKRASSKKAAESKLASSALRILALIALKSLI